MTEQSRGQRCPRPAAPRRRRTLAWEASLGLGRALVRATRSYIKREGALPKIVRHHALSLTALVIVPADVDADALIVTIVLFVTRDGNTFSRVQLIDAGGEPAARERSRLGMRAGPWEEPRERAVCLRQPTVVKRPSRDLDVPYDMTPLVQHDQAGCIFSSHEGEPHSRPFLSLFSLARRPLEEGQDDGYNASDHRYRGKHQLEPEWSVHSLHDDRTRSEGREEACGQIPPPSPILVSEASGPHTSMLWTASGRRHPQARGSTGEDPRQSLAAASRYDGSRRSPARTGRSRAAHLRRGSPATALVLDSTVHGNICSCRSEGAHMSGSSARLSRAGSRSS